MQDPAGNLDQLAHLVPVLDDHGEPMRSSGAFAVVFKMKDESTGKEYALKCFTEDQEGRAEAYRQIADELESVDSTYVTSVKYLEKELFVDSNCDDDEFPVLLMDWIEGETMDRYIAENLYDNYAMSMLCYRFCKMAAWLRSQPFAHGDIKPDNIMVRPDGSLTLIDYDGMFVPAMKGQTSPTIGTKDFSHPLRTKDDFDETIDDFALATIALSLKAISLTPSLFDEYASADRLLFSADDYRDLSQSKVLPALQPLMADSELNTLLSLFLLAHATKTLSMDSFRLFSISKPEYVLVDISTEVTDEDLAEAIEDEYGVKYSKDGKRLLDAKTCRCYEYHIRKGTLCICDEAFWGCRIICIVIPESVKKIGWAAFDFCYDLTSLVIPNGMTEIGDYAFSGCSGLTGIKIPDGVTRIGASAFSYCSGLTKIAVSESNPAYASYDNCCLSKDLKILKFGCKTSVIPDVVTMIAESAFDGCSGLTDIKIPDGVTRIGAMAFRGCSGLTGIEIPANVSEIAESAFDGCSGLTSIKIPDGVTRIGKSAFRGCSRLTNIEIPSNVLEIGDYAFSGCSGLTGIKIPDDVTRIGNSTFQGCSRLTNIEIPSNVSEIGDFAFNGCSGLIGIKIPDGVTRIGEVAFCGCSGLTSIEIPSSVSEIVDYAFCGCSGLTGVLKIPDGVTRVAESAFDGCSGLTGIKIPDGVTRIGAMAFRGCSHLTNMEIPSNVSDIGDYAFSGCSGLTGIIKIPDGLKRIAESAFDGCSGLTGIKIPDGVTRIGKSAFRGCPGLTSIKIPDSVSEIGLYAFNGCSGLESIMIPNSVTKIGSFAFAGCNGLTSVEIPNSVMEIGKGAFDGCNLPESVKKELTAKYGCRIFEKRSWNNFSAL